MQSMMEKKILDYLSSAIYHIPLKNLSSQQVVNFFESQIGIASMSECLGISSAKLRRWYSQQYLPKLNKIPEDIRRKIRNLVNRRLEQHKSISQGFRNSVLKHYGNKYYRFSVQQLIVQTKQVWQRQRTSKQRIQDNLLAYLIK